MKLNKNHFLSCISGRLGNLVFVKTKTGTHVRTKPRRSIPLSEQQQSSSKRFSFACRFVSKGRAVFQPGFAGTGNWYALALKAAIGAVELHSSCFSVDYSSLKVSAGTLRGPQKVKVENNEKGIRFSWNCKKNHPLKAKVAVMVAAYLPLHDTWLTSRAWLGECSQVLPVPENFAEGYAETYVFVRNEEENRASSSIYLGPVEI